MSHGLRSTTQLFTTSNFIGPWYHAALLISGLRSIVLLFALLFSQQIREDLVRAAKVSLYLNNQTVQLGKIHWLKALKEFLYLSHPDSSPQGNVLKTSTTNPNARGLGDPNLLQSYFVCVTESESTTLIEYGKTMGTTESGDIYLNMLDVGERLNVRFYAFGNGDKKLDVIDAHIVSRDMTKADCKGDTHMDLETRLCTQRCHKDCDPLHGKKKKKIC